jgi:hypothetical protein
MKQQPEILNSWKEISNYLGRGVRTVQRWERDFGLPVRRPAGHLKSSVIALRSDVDQWLLNRAKRDLALPRPASSLNPVNCDRLAANLTELHRQLAALNIQQKVLLEYRERIQRLRQRRSLGRDADLRAATTSSSAA